jgi:hypothetical protein
LPSVRKKALGKEPFADEIFAECKIAFAECLRHSAKNAIPVVREGQGGARQGVQRVGHLGDLLRPQRLCSRRQDDGVRGSGLTAWVHAKIGFAVCTDTSP